MLTGHGDWNEDARKFNETSSADIPENIYLILIYPKLRIRFQ